MIIPSIDLMNGKAVCLRQGKKKIFEVKSLQRFIRLFKVFPEVHIIDLDAALGRGDNREMVKGLCRQLSCNVGGGVRTVAQAQEYLRAGAKQVIIGTCATPKFLEKLPAHRVLVALDMKQGKLAIEGWRRTVTGSLQRKITQLEPYCAGFLVTNVDVEGLDKGVDRNFIKNLQGLTKKRVIVAGGIGSYQEVQKISRLGFDQVIGLALYTEKINVYQAVMKVLDFSKGLIPTVTVDQYGQIGMVGFSNAQAVVKTLRTRQVTFWSRSRNKLWTKGGTSGHKLSLQSFVYDCDADTLIYHVVQNASVCHTGMYTCFGKQAFTLSYLLSVLRGRIKSRESGSYTAHVASQRELLSEKILEEANEVINAHTKDERVWELADVLYFLLLYMAKYRVSLADVLNELSVRHRYALPK